MLRLESFKDTLVVHSAPFLIMTVERFSPDFGISIAFFVILNPFFFPVISFSRVKWMMCKAFLSLLSCSNGLRDSLD